MGNDAWPKGLVPFKAAPSHSGFEDGIVTGKAFNVPTARNITVGLVRVYKRRLSNVQGFSSGIVKPQFHRNKESSYVGNRISETIDSN